LLPGNVDYLVDSRILSIRSPITGNIKMKLTRDGGFNHKLRLLLERAIDGPGFQDKTSSTTSGSTIIRGTGQWSDVRAVGGIALVVDAPTLSGWGKILLTLLMLMAMIWSLWRYGTKSNRVSRHP
jgi:hypothetical protein